MRPQTQETRGGAVDCGGLVETSRYGVLSVKWQKGRIGHTQRPPYCNNHITHPWALGVYEGINHVFLGFVPWNLKI